jgi:hypothetical protein
MTYDELKEQIKFITTKGNEPSFDAQLPTIIENGQRETQLRLNILQSQETVTGFIYPGTQEIIKPYNWLYTVAIDLTNPDENDKYYPMKRRVYGYVRRIQDNSTVAGIPEFYSNEDQDQKFLFAPIAAPLTNASAYSYTLRYHVLVNPLNETNQQNWMTKTYSTILLQACLYYAFLFLRNMSVASFHLQQMTELVGVARKTDLLGKTDENINHKVS